MERKEPTFSASAAPVERDDTPVSAPQQRQAATAKTEAPRAKRPVTPPVLTESVSAAPVAAASPSSSLGVTALLMSLIGVGMALYLLWSLTTAQQQLADANSRILELQQALVLTGDESTQSVTTLQANLKKQQGDVAALKAELAESNHEIRKLWDTRNVNRKAISDNKEDLEAAIAQLQGLPAELKKAREQLSAQQKLVDGLKADARQALESATLLGATVERQQQRMRELVDAGVQAERRLTDTTARLVANEEAIRSIDAFRKSTNSELWKLKQALPAAPR